MSALLLLSTIAAHPYVRVQYALICARPFFPFAAPSCDEFIRGHITSVSFRPRKMVLFVFAFVGLIWKWSSSERVKSLKHPSHQRSTWNKWPARSRAEQKVVGNERTAKRSRFTMEMDMVQKRLSIWTEGDGMIGRTQTEENVRAHKHTQTLKWTARNTQNDIDRADKQHESNTE